MPRPKACRTIGCLPDVRYFKPKGIPTTMLAEVNLTLDEFEAIKLADFAGLYQEEAALKMSVSRQTFGRIIASAHRKVADVLMHGKALRIEGGVVAAELPQDKTCSLCKRSIVQDGLPVDLAMCPRCQKKTKVQHASQESEK